MSMSFTVAVGRVIYFAVPKIPGSESNTRTVNSQGAAGLPSCRVSVFLAAEKPLTLDRSLASANLICKRQVTNVILISSVPVETERATKHGTQGHGAQHGARVEKPASRKARRGPALSCWSVWPLPEQCQGLGPSLGLSCGKCLGLLSQ